MIDSSFKPLFSIVLPTWNRATLIKDALRSLQSQTYSHFEVVIVDNHSTDNTEEVVREFGDSRFKYFYPERKLSQLECYTYGWNLSKGEFASSLDDDNVWRKNSLLKIKTIIDTNSDIELICFDRGLIYHVEDHPNLQLRNKLRIHGFSGQCFMYNDSKERIRAFCENIRFDQPYPGITNSFVRTKTLNRILNSYEDIFPGKCIGGEEVVAVLLLNGIDSFVFLDEPLCVFGESGRNSTAELVSGNPDQQEFKEWYKGNLSIALENAPVGLPLYPNFSLFGLRRAQELIGLKIEPNWVEYYHRCEEWINLMYNWWGINPKPLIETFERDIRKHHPHLLDEYKSGGKPQSTKTVRIAPQLLSGDQNNFFNIAQAKDVIDRSEPSSGWF